MSLDVLVSFDTTGSMYPALAEVRRKVTEFINSLFSTIPGLRIGLIAHGDYHDVYETKHVLLTTNKDELIKFVRIVEKTNGFGNGGELYEVVINQARKFNWESENRVMIMLGDEPAHYQGKIVSSLYDKKVVTLDWIKEAIALKQEGVTLYPIRCLDRYDSIKFHESLAKINNVPLLKLQQFANIIPLLNGIVYKQESDDRLEKYGTELEKIGVLDRNLAEAFNLLLGATNLIGGKKYSQSTTDLESVSPSRFQMLNVDVDTPIKDFVQSTGATFRIGRGFYELTKTELVQENKEVVLRNAVGDMFSGAKAREMIGLPFGQRGKIGPQRNLGYIVFIQSTSPNRKLIGNTKFLYEVESS